MKERIDRLSKDLAQGVSRRKALWMFLAGTGALSAAGGQKALASDRRSKFLCDEACTRQAEAFLELCMQASECCPTGHCAEFTLLRVNSTQLRVNGTVVAFEESCTPVRC